jgi:hypothetical protein
LQSLRMIQIFMCWNLWSMLELKFGR